MSEKIYIAPYFGVQQHRCASSTCWCPHRRVYPWGLNEINLFARIEFTVTSTEKVTYNAHVVFDIASSYYCIIIL